MLKRPELITVKNSAGEELFKTAYAYTYYYDVETGFYYLQSRYYDPANHRFINADCYTDTGTGFLGYNMFAYCLNNPVALDDVAGRYPSASVCVATYEHRGGSGEKTYESEEDAAFAAGVLTRRATNIYNKEFACGVYLLDYGRYAIGKCYMGEHDGVLDRPIFDEAAQYEDRTLVAIVHSHPYCTGHVPNEFSIIDPYGNVLGDWEGVAKTGIPLYLAAPNGSLQKLFIRDIVYYDGFVGLIPGVIYVRWGLPEDTTLFDCLGRQGGFE